MPDNDLGNDDRLKPLIHYEIGSRYVHSHSAAIAAPIQDSTGISSPNAARQVRAARFNKVHREGWPAEFWYRPGCDPRRQGVRTVRVKTLLPRERALATERDNSSGSAQERGSR